MSVTAVLSRNRRLAAGLLTAVAVASLAACGSDDDSSGDTSTTPAGGNASAGPGGGGRNNSAMTAYINCLSENGVTITMPSGGPGGGNGGTPPSGAPNGGTPPSGGARPSGNPGGGGGGREITQPDGVDDATWTKATTACATLKPTANASAPTS
ncbi:hypothetical protein BJ973_002379 [Actinoplanes tereljensis]|uniref:Uncharacterized protein n=1 Tax=Paractinoplanes tereljensis TaxID=571912 RepID=A0A919NQL9_9ACTN|nr:hypothetical protein [Actinoplanes tereljensis]GIF22052.1 hypothetical protein Ate02nite_47820 [Actinoplanes tereljensis]